MKYMRALKKQLDFKGRLIDVYDFSGEILPPMLGKLEFEEKKYPKTMYSAIRCVSGNLQLSTKDTVQLLPQNALMILPSKNIQFIRSTESVTMTIYNFTSEKAPVFFQPEECYHVPFDRLEEQQKQLLLSPERENELAANSALHALFRVQYYGWISAYEKKDVTHQRLYEKEIRRTAELIETEPGRKINFTELSKTLNLSERNFRKMFTIIMGMSPKAYQQELRLKTAASELKDTDRSMAEISEELGYYSQFQFSRDFKKRFGVTPSEYKKSS